MREIKFRAWEKHYKKMLRPHRLIWRNDTWELVFIEFDFKELEEYPPYPIFRDIPERVELMQFTGLHDKNGKEIYEGDICRIEYPQETRFRPNQKYHVFEVKWDKIGWTNLLVFQCEVIGNIYENPELLEGEK